MEYDNKAESLYNGNPLTKVTFEDFKRRLSYHVKGKGVDDHCTANALFVVQAKRYIVGIDPDYDPALCIVDSEDCETYYSMNEFIDSLDEDSIQYYGLGSDYSDDLAFADLDESEQWEILKYHEKLDVTGYDERWEYVNAHFTKEAALRFIERKKHDYPEGLRVIVDSQYWAWEFNTIIDAILEGVLVLGKEIK